MINFFNKNINQNSHNPRRNIQSNVYNNKNNFKATVSFLMRIVEGDDETILVKISHIIEFTSCIDDFNLKERESNFILFEIMLICL